MAQSKKLTNLHVLMAIDVLGIGASPPTLAETLGVSITTVYKYLNEMYSLSLAEAMHIGNGPTVYFVLPLGRRHLYTEYHGNY